MPRLALILLALAFLVAPVDAAGRGRALLVGVTKYPHLGEDRALTGPGNDVPMKRALLRDHFGVADADIAVLTDADGAKDSKLAAILCEAIPDVRSLRLHQQLFPAVVDVWAARGDGAKGDAGPEKKLAELRTVLVLCWMDGRGYLLLDVPAGVSKAYELEATGEELVQAGRASARRLRLRRELVADLTALRKGRPGESPVTLDVWYREALARLSGTAVDVSSGAASGDTNGLVYLWDVATRKVLHTIEGHQAGGQGVDGGVVTLVYTRDGTRLASATYGATGGGELKIWDTERGMEAFTTPGHLTVAFRPDGRALATAAGDASQPHHVRVIEASAPAK